MSVSNLTNTKWLINNAPAIFENTFSYSINFISNNTNYTAFASVDEGGDLYVLKYNNTAAFEDWDGATTWYNEAYKTIEITGGTDVTNAGLINWLEAYAVQISETTKDITTITGYSGLSAGQHTLGVKATDSSGTYTDSTMATTTFTKLEAPGNESISSNNYTFGEVANAEEYDIYAGNTLLGTVVPISGFTVSGTFYRFYSSAYAQNGGGAHIFYSFDDGATWTELSTIASNNQFSISNVTQIKFKAIFSIDNLKYGIIKSTALSMNLDTWGGSGDEQISNNYILSSNVTDIQYDTLQD